jgi:capsule assembly protein Wzi
VRLCAGALVLLAASAHARGVSPYLPVDLAPEIERKIERVLILAEQPALKRPIAAATVLDALPRACERDAALCAEVRRYLGSLARTAGISHASVAVGAGSGPDTPLPNRHGMGSRSNYEVSGAVYWQPGDRLLVTGGVVAYEGGTTPTGSTVSLGGEYFQVDLGFRDRSWSAFSESSMLLGTQATTMPSITVGNYAPLSRFGFRYEAFIAEMSHSDNISHLGAPTSGRPRLAGLHLSLEPFPGWSVGVNRVLQYGGGDRPSRFEDLVRAFVDPSTDNTAGEFGNQTAAFTTEFIAPTEVPFAVYFEYAGEDTSTNNNLRLGNVAFAAGVTLPKLGERYSLTVELSEWQNGWYQHHLYGDGLRNEGRIVGHWGADWRLPGDDVGARSTLLKLGVAPRGGGYVEATYRTLDNEGYGAAVYERAHLLEARYDRPWRQFSLGVELHAGQDSFGESFTRVATSIRF